MNESVFALTGLPMTEWNVRWWMYWSSICEEAEAKAQEIAEKIRRRSASK